MPAQISPSEARALQKGNTTLALIDVREHGEYRTARIPGSIPVPRCELEIRLERLVSCRRTRLILCDDDGRRRVVVAPLHPSPLAGVPGPCCQLFSG
ncbi:MAG: rhodanese-like domain-containing protein [Dehalococcoidia bacterium]